MFGYVENNSWTKLLTQQFYNVASTECKHRQILTLCTTKAKLVPVGCHTLYFKPEGGHKFHINLLYF